MSRYDADCMCANYARDLNSYPSCCCFLCVGVGLLQKVLENVMQSTTLSELNYEL